MTKLFSYVVDHDYGVAPNPFGGFCTLAKCKYSKGKRRNVVELAEEGNWIVGTGGADTKKSAGHGKLIYAMRVDEKLPLAVYFHDKRFRGRKDNDTAKSFDRFVLVSRQFFYFGRNAISINRIPKRHLAGPIEKKGPGFPSDFSQQFIGSFAKWLEGKYRVGIHGLPCGVGQDELTQKQC